MTAALGFTLLALGWVLGCWPFLVASAAVVFGLLAYEKARLRLPQYQPYLVAKYALEANCRRERAEGIDYETPIGLALNRTVNERAAALPRWAQWLR